MRDKLKIPVSRKISVTTAKPKAARLPIVRLLKSTATPIQINPGDTSPTLLP
ncbi:hypothetical protein D3C78_1103160 [compost metagenome]